MLTKKPILSISFFMAFFLISCNYDSNPITEREYVSGPIGLSGKAVTYEGQIKALFEKRCTACHKSGAFNWTDYATIKNNITFILKAIESGSMPVGGSKLPDSEISLIKQWVASGMPQVATGPSPEPTEPSPEPTPTDPEPRPPVPGEKVTFIAQIKPLFEKRSCTACHANAPRDWANYDNVKESIDLILGAIESGRMPLGGEPLPPNEIALVKKWIKEGMPEGGEPVPSPDPNPDFNAKEEVESRCISCHSVPSGEYPTITGQNKAYLLKELEHFKAGRRIDGVVGYMNLAAQRYSSSELKKMVHYLSNEDRCRIQADINPLGGDIQKGKEIFQNKCTGCHTASSTSAPYIFGLGTDYLKRTMNSFIATENPRPGTIMRSMLSYLDTKDILNVAAYVNTLGECNE